MGPLDRRLLARAAPARRLLVLDAAAGVARTLLLLVQVTLIAIVVADVVEEGTAPSPGLLLGLVAVIAGRALLTQLVERLGRDAAVTVQSSLRLELVRRRLQHPGDDAGRWPPADLATAAVEGVDGLEVYFGRYLPQLVLAVVVPIAVIAWSAVVDLGAALVMVITVPIVPIFMWLIGRTAASRADAHLDALVRLSAHFLDLVRGLPTLRAFGRGRAQASMLERSAEEYRRTTMGTLRLAFLSGLVLDLATTLSIALVAVTLGVRLVGGSVGLRAALTVLLLVPELYAPMRQVGLLFHASADGLAQARHILDALDDDAQRSSSETVRTRVVPPRPRIDVDAVEVRFEGRPRPALDGVQLLLEPGESVAVVGPSGSGKTTLGRVLLGLQPVDAGTVLVGGVALEEVVDTWRTRVAWAAQRPALLHGSVAENLALGAPEADAAAIRAAAVAAGADEFVRALPQGYDTPIGPAGRGLSAGQRQRLGLARALLRAADLVVLDEPTAHLDPVAAAHVAATIARHRGEAAIVVLTHDPDVAAVADRTLTLTDGRLVPGRPTSSAPVAT